MIILLVSLYLLVSLPNPNIPNLQHNIGLVIVILAFISLFAFIIDLAGYQANFIQLGLDQLFEAPSLYIILFIHFAKWAFNFGSLHFIMNLFMVMCIRNEICTNDHTLSSTCSISLSSFITGKLLESSMVPQ